MPITIPGIICGETMNADSAVRPAYLPRTSENAHEIPSTRVSTVTHTAMRRETKTESMSWSSSKKSLYQRSVNPSGGKLM